MRAAWRALVAGEAGIGAERLVFVDEMGANASLAPLRAWSRRGERARLSAPRNRGKNTTLLASMTLSGMGPTLAVAGGTTKEVFEAYVERVLAPTLRPGQVVVLDNLAAHKGEVGARAGRGAGLRSSLPAGVLAGLQPHRGGVLEDKGAALRKAQARTREALIEAMGAAISAVTAGDARGFFQHCGYHLLLGQLL